MWGYHLRLDAAGCNDSIKDAESVARFATDLVSTIGMTAYGAPQIVRFGDDPKVSGFTLVQLIETSNINAHFCDFTAEAYVDIFSCKPFDTDLAIACFARHFEPTAISHDFKARQAPLMDSAETG